MVSNIVNMFSNALVSGKVNQTTAVKPVSKNPFENPFVATQSSNRPYSYAKNNPVQGGYFAGYHNGKQNIVGQRLFVEA